MSKPHEIHDVADLAIAYLDQDRAFFRLKSIMQAMHPWVLYGFEQDGETDAFHLTFADGGNEINFLSDGSGGIFAKKSGEENWVTETQDSGEAIPLESMIGILQGIKSRLTQGHAAPK